MVKYCRTCRLADLKRNICQLSRMAIDPDKDFCSKHTTVLDTCDKCGRATLKSWIIPKGNDEWALLCEDCSQLINTCFFCSKGNECRFETDPSPIPKYIQKQVRQGPMITVTEEKNPERVRQTCQNGCLCYDNDFGCMKQFNYCKEMDYIYGYPERDDAGEPGLSADDTEVHSEIHE